MPHGTEVGLGPGDIVFDGDPALPPRGYSPQLSRCRNWVVQGHSDGEPAMTIFKCLRGLALTYLTDDCLAMSAITGKRHLWSAHTGMPSVPGTKTTLGMRSFAVVGPVIWNSLPAALRTATLSPLTFARRLRAQLFG